jgi:hypothetical protein
MFPVSETEKKKKKKKKTTLQILGAALAASAGVMIYVSLVEILSKVRVLFVRCSFCSLMSPCPPSR